MELTALRAGRRGRKPWWLPSLGLLVPVLLASFPISASASESGDAAVVDSESEFRNAWANPRRTAIELADDIFLRHCKTGDPIRESARPMVLDGNGHTIRQVCFEKRVLRQDGTGYVLLKNVALTRGGSDGPGAAFTSRGEIEIRDSRISENLAEEPGGGVFSMRRITVARSVLTGNLANDDGGALYARRGGVEVRDSIVSGNLVDGSGGAIGSTGDILVEFTRRWQHD
jgi:Putative pectate lyase-like adhesive domain